MTFLGDSKLTTLLVCGWVFLWGLCVCACLYLYFHWRSNYLQKGRSFGSLNQFNPVTFFVPVPNRELVLHRYMSWYFVCSMICLRFVLFILMELWLFFINICNDVRVIVTTNSVKMSLSVYWVHNPVLWIVISESYTCTSASWFDW